MHRKRLGIPCHQLSNRTRYGHSNAERRADSRWTILRLPHDRRRREARATSRWMGQSLSRAVAYKLMRFALD